MLFAQPPAILAIKMIFVPTFEEKDGIFVLVVFFSWQVATFYPAIFDVLFLYHPKIDVVLKSKFLTRERFLKKHGGTKIVNMANLEQLIREIVIF